MSTSVSFLTDPQYGKTLVLFVLSPPGIPFDPAEIARNLYGKREVSIDPITLPGLAPKNAFRFSDIALHWPDFLGLAFEHSDHALFYVPGKKKFQEIRRESLLQQNPDLYSFSFFRLHCATYETPVTTEETVRAEAAHMAAPTTAPDNLLRSAREALGALLDAGWSANAVAKTSGINPITIGNLRHDRQKSVTARVHDALLSLQKEFEAGTVALPTRKKKGAAAKTSSGTAARTATPAGNGRSAPAEPRYVSVNADRLDDLLARLVATFTDAVEELERMKKLI
jgi:hypothetical protein